MTLFARKSARYVAVSLFNTVLGEVIIAICFGLFRWSGWKSALVATIIVTAPSYVLSRMWVWGRTGSSHLTREVVPFWVLALVGLVLATWAAGAADKLSNALTDSRSGQTLIVMASTLLALGLLWVARFVILDRLVFGSTRDQDEHVGQSGPIDARS